MRSIAKAPGSLMIMGEHAVLHGQPSLVAAIDKWLKIEAHFSTTEKIIIHSSLACFEGSLQALKKETSLRFVYHVLAYFNRRLGKDFVPVVLTIKAEFKSTLGFGSSSAVLVAGIGALYQLFYQSIPDPYELFDIALALLHQVQGRGSGADLAAAVFGQLVYYQAEPRHIEPLAASLSLTAIYCGYKTPTSEVLQLIAKKEEKEPLKYQKIYKEIGHYVTLAKHALTNHDDTTFYQMIHHNQNCMQRLGVSDDTLELIIKRLKPMPSKISGSGLGDCVIAFTSDIPAFTFSDHPNIQLFPLKLSTQGIQYELTS